MRVLTLITLNLLISISIFAQKYSGVILNKKTSEPIEYVNIGVVGKGVGTVSDSKGRFALSIDSVFNKDTLMISCIGYKPVSLKVTEFKRRKDKSIFLEEIVYSFKEVVIHPIKYKKRTLGFTSKSKNITIGFNDSIKMGYESGVMMNVKKQAVIDKININVASCTYDSIFLELIYTK